jgi:hypothetical protein
MVTLNCPPEALPDLVRAEYLEMPGLSLTRAQIQRMWGLDASDCDVVINALMSGGFLRKTQRDQYARADLHV